MKINMKKKTNDLVYEDAISGELNPQQLKINSEPADPAELERIIKTTDSMNIIASLGLGKESDAQAHRQSRAELANIRESIYRSFDLARRKITTEYEQIIVSGNYVDNPFLAVQVTLKNFERNWNIQMVENIIKKFTEAIPEQIALGKTIYLSEDLTIEPIVYIDKILPSWKITPNFALLSNALRWEDLVNKLIEDGELTHDAKEIVKEAIEAISVNIANGYYVKVSRMIVLQLTLGANQKLVLFSNDTLQKMNEIYTRFMKTGEKKQINKYDTVAHFERTRENIERGFYNEDVKATQQTQEAEFIPQDLVAEIPQEATSSSYTQETTLTPFEQIEAETKAAKDAEVKAKEDSKAALIASTNEAVDANKPQDLILEPSAPEVKEDELKVHTASEDDKNVEIFFDEVKPEVAQIISNENKEIIAPEKTKEELKAEAKAAKEAAKEAKKAEKEAAKEAKKAEKEAAKNGEEVKVEEQVEATPSEEANVATPELVLEEPAVEEDNEPKPISDADFFAEAATSAQKLEKTKKKKSKE